MYFLVIKQQQKNVPTNDLAVLEKLPFRPGLSRILRTVQFLLINVYSGTST